MRLPGPPYLPSLSALSQWPVGVDGVISAVPGTSRLFCRLREMGVVPGMRIRVLRTGASLVVQVEESRLCLRRRDAAPILVSSHPAGAAPGAPH
ncbi:MAG: ferrous iron transport protein A [Candidatus Handelsmanbacteria bacterium]|nr:ferrous iron transport protein A [Candidatus Handelsmanbacteria bacterium]